MSRAIRIAMIAMTTSSSMRVKPMGFSRFWTLMRHLLPRGENGVYYRRSTTEYHRKHVILAVVFDDHHVLDPDVFEERIPRMACPADAVPGSGIAQHAQVVGRAVVASVPEFVQA